MKALWERKIKSNLDQLPLLTASEQTRGSWAREIEDPEMVPDLYKDFYGAQLNGDSNFPYTVITPKFNGFLRQENEKLIFSLGNKIYVLENINGEVIDSCYSIQNINYIESGSVLLKAWIRINGLTDEGTFTSSTLRFNAVTEYMFQPFMDQIRSAEHAPHQTGIDSELAQFDYLSEIDFKFMNYAKNAVSPGDRVIDHIFQSEIRSTIIAIFGKSLYRTISPTHISILTEQVFIIIKDTGKDKANGNRRFGGIRLYIPIEKIKKGTIIVKDDDLLEFSLKLANDDQVDILFSALNKQDIERIQDRLGEMKGLVPAGQK